MVGSDPIGLLHDLGKYIVMPLSYLPADASDSEVREAVMRGLRHTHGGRSARELWCRFDAKVSEDVRMLKSYARLRLIVERALDWEGANSIDRVAAKKDLAAVSPAIRAVIDELRGKA